jgi:hypothetical protein
MGHLIIYCNGLIVAARGWTAETRRLCERPRASILSVLRQSGEHTETRFARRLSFIQLLHQVTRRRKPPQIRFFRSLPGPKGIQASASFSPAEIKRMIGLPQRPVGSCHCGQPQCRCPCPRLAFVENCIGSWLTERKCRGNGRSAGGGAALGSPACCDNRTSRCTCWKASLQQSDGPSRAAASHHLQF